MSREELEQKICDILENVFEPSMGQGIDEMKSIMDLIDAHTGLLEKNCGTCKYLMVADCVAPCYGCRDNSGYDNHEPKHTP